MNKVKGLSVSRSLFLAAALFACAGSAKATGGLKVLDVVKSVGKKGWGSFSAGANSVKTNHPKVHSYIVNLAVYGVCSMGVGTLGTAILLAPLKVFNNYTFCSLAKIPLLGLIPWIPCTTLSSVLNPYYVLCTFLVLYLVVTTDPEKVKKLVNDARKSISDNIKSLASSPFVALNSVKSLVLSKVLSYFSGGNVEQKQEDEKQESTPKQEPRVEKTAVKEEDSKEVAAGETEVVEKKDQDKGVKVNQPATVVKTSQE